MRSYGQVLPLIADRGVALQTMMGGNKRFTQGQLTSLNDDLKILKEHTAESQVPFAPVLPCADSRVHVELVFDQRIGHLFGCCVRRQYRNRRSDRQPRTGCRGGRHHGDHGARPRQLRRGRRHDQGQGGARPYQRAVSSPASSAQLTIDTPLARS
jgi:hypothetical protein